jgi:hypothetical protein
LPPAYDNRLSQIGIFFILKLNVKEKTDNLSL